MSVLSIDEVFLVDNVVVYDANSLVKLYNNITSVNTNTLIIIIVDSITSMFYWSVYTNNNTKIQGLSVIYEHIVSHSYIYILNLIGLTLECCIIVMSPMKFMSNYYHIPKKILCGFLCLDKHVEQLKHMY